MLRESPVESRFCILYLTQERLRKLKVDYVKKGRSYHLSSDQMDLSYQPSAVVLIGLTPNARQRRHVHDSLLWPRYARTRRHAEAELRINNSCYKAFRYGDIDYVYRLCESEDDDNVNATVAADVMLQHDTMKIMITRARMSGGRVRRTESSTFWLPGNLDGSRQKSVAFIPAGIRTHVCLCTSNANMCEHATK